MTHATRRSNRGASRSTGRWTTEPDPREFQHLSALDPVVYIIRRRDGVIKIGWTANLARRAKELGGEILAFQFGTRADEQAIHHSLRDHLAHGREYYYPTPFVLARVNEMRERLRLPLIAA